MVCVVIVSVAVEVVLANGYRVRLHMCAIWEVWWASAVFTSTVIKMYVGNVVILLCV